MNIFFIIALVVILSCIYSQNTEQFSCGKSCNCGKSCTCGKSCSCDKCSPQYKCTINKHLRRKCTWTSPCYN